MLPNEPQAASAPAPTQYVIFDALHYVGVLWRRKWRILLMGLALFLAGWALSYTQPKLYESNVRFMPPARTVTTLIYSLSRTPGEEYRAMLNSDSVGYDVVEHQDLTSYFKTTDVDVARARLTGTAKFTIDTNNFITISIRSTDPAYSLRIANEYYAALFRLTERLAASEARHRLDSMAGPLQIERDRLTVAEDALRDAQQKTGLVLPSAQGALGVQQVATLRMRVSELDGQLAALRTSSTDANPRVVDLRSQIENLNGQIHALETGGGQVNSPGRLPELSLEVQRRERDVKALSDEMEALTRALDISRTQDTYVPSLSLIDSARLPRNKVSPSRKLWAMVGGFLGILAGLSQVLLATAFRRWKATHNGTAQIESWRKAFKGSPAGQANGV